MNETIWVVYNEHADQDHRRTMVTHEGQAYSIAKNAAHRLWKEGGDPKSVYVVKYTRTTATAFEAEVIGRSVDE